MKRFKNILYLCENSVDQRNSIARAVALADANQASLTVMDVIERDFASVSELVGVADLQIEIQSQRANALQDLLAPYRSRLPLRVEVLSGKRFLEALRAVLHRGYDLVIKPGEDPDWVERLFGSDDMQLLRKCPCPLWIMKAQQQKYQTIIAAIDFGRDFSNSQQQELNRLILQLASSIAIAESAALHIVHAWEAPAVGMLQMWADHPEAAKQAYIESERAHHQNNINQLNHLLPQWIGQDAYDYCSPQYHLPMNAPAIAIPHMVKSLRADLVVMGTVARTGIAGFVIGNTAEAILDQLQCSVLALKPPGFETPVKL